MNEKPLKVLLVEDDLEDVALFEEALVEIEESLYTREWMRRCEFVPSDRVAEALDLIQRESFDVILLDTSLPDGSGLDAFLRVQRAAPAIPIVVLAATDDEPLAVSLVRQGAQDYLLKRELDCAPLARALRCAIERHRVRNALRTLTFLDDLTGLYSWGGFLNLANRCLNMAVSSGRGARLFLIDFDAPGATTVVAQERESDLRWMLAADWLRGAFREHDVIGRRELGCFAVLAIEDSAARLREVETALENGVKLVHAATDGPVYVRFAVAATDGSSDRPLEKLLELAEESLWENRRSRAKAIN